ncbi:MAG: ribonuclease T2 [Pseudomonadota bacterium]
MRAPILALALALAAPALAEGDQPGEFDYYVLALSWSPSWCEIEGDAREADQCNPGSGYGWILHGLWPQYEDGWPSDCRTTERDPNRRMTRDMADIMGSSGLAWHQWKKHGRCAGLPAARYFDLSRQAYEAVARPDVFRRLPDPVEIRPDVIEEAFIAANPGLSPSHMTVSCRDGHIVELRVCLTKGLAPRDCTGPAARSCGRAATLLPLD